MKKSFTRVALMAMATLAMSTMVSCGSDEPIKASQDEVEAPAADYDVPDYEVVEVREYTAEEIADLIYNPAEAANLTPEEIAMRQEARDAFLEADALRYEELAEQGIDAPSRSSVVTTYEKAVINYTSRDHNGNYITLSGLVAFQHWRSIVWLVQPVRTIDKILIENHYTIVSDEECPSLSGTVLEGTMYTFPGAVISADYQGYGKSAGSFHPYLNQQVTARQQVDFIKVALDYLKGQTKYITIPEDELKTYNLGYSQGGAVTVAVQKYLEQYERDLMKTLNFRGSIAGDGPYNLTNTFNFYRETGVVNMPIVLPLIVQGMMNSYPELFEGITIDKYFNYVFLHANWWSDKSEHTNYNSILDMMNTKLYTTDDFDKMFAKAIPEKQAKFTGNAKYNFEFDGYDISLLLSSDAMNPDSKISKALIAAFEKNNVLNGWTPTYPVYFYHCVKDPVVPYVNLRDMPWPSDVYMIDERTFFKNHTYGGYKFYVDLIFSSNIESYFGFFNLERGKPVIGDLPGQL